MTPPNPSSDWTDRERLEVIVWLTCKMRNALFERRLQSVWCDDELDQCLDILDQVARQPAAFLELKRTTIIEALEGTKP